MSDLTREQARAIASNTTLTMDEVLAASQPPQDAALCIHDMRLLQAPDQIERVEESDGQVRWKGMMLLSPGVWTDAGSGEAVFYSPEGIRNSHERWEENRVNFFHEIDDETWKVGQVDTDTATVDDHGRLFADVVLSMENKASELADEALQKAFETGGRQGVKGPSVELRGEEYRFNTEHGVKELVRGTFTGLGLVGVGLMPGPASTTASFEAQARERAVAMTGQGNGQVKVLTLKEHVNADKGVPGVTPDLDDLDADDVSLAEHAAPLLAKKWNLDEADVLSMLENTQAKLQDDGDEDPDEAPAVEVDTAAIEDAIRDAMEQADDEDELVPTIVQEISEALDADAAMVESVLTGDATTAPATILEAIAERLNVDPTQLVDDDEDEEDDDEEEEALAGKLQEALDKLDTFQDTVDKRLSALENEAKPPKSLADATPNGQGDDDALDLDTVHVLGHHEPRAPINVR